MPYKATPLHSLIAYSEH